MVTMPDVISGRRKGNVNEPSMFSKVGSKEEEREDYISIRA
jgi:hypothetical protein